MDEIIYYEGHRQIGLVFSETCYWSEIYFGNFAVSFSNKSQAVT